MNVPDFPREIHEVYGIHSALVKLGFSSDDIHTRYAIINNRNTDRRCFAVILKTQSKEFIVACSSLPAPYDNEEKAVELWNQFCAVVKTAPDQELADAIENSGILIEGQFTGLARALLLKGFQIP